MEALLGHGRALGCGEAWVLTDESNATARRMYERAGGIGTSTMMYTFPLAALYDEPAIEDAKRTMRNA
jgi:aminoglycoside 6'-N-acetyltransferase I